MEEVVEEEVEVIDVNVHEEEIEVIDVEDSE